MSHHHRLLLHGLSVASFLASNALTGCTPPLPPATPDDQSGPIPQQPSAAALTKAVRPVILEAKSCVVGADDFSLVKLTFVSDGSVSNVSVAGWAVKNGKVECLEAVLKKARVRPFSDPTFSVVTRVSPE